MIRSEDTSFLPEVLLWYNAHNQAVVLYERAEGALACPNSRIIRLDDTSLRSTLELTAEANNLVLVP